MSRRSRIIVGAGGAVLLLALVLLTGYFPEWLGGKVIRPEPGTTFTVQASAYASSPRQTDKSPCINASGLRVREEAIATNFLPLGTIVKYNGQLYIVEDRMNRRYNRNVDFWFPHTSEALEFGRKNITIEIVGYGKPGQDVRQQEAVVEAAPEPSTYQRANIRFLAFTRFFGLFLRAAVNPDVNRFDVNCSTS